MNRQVVEGIFIKETKSRFLCIVDINGSNELCYISSSSKLRHFINLSGRKVLLSLNTGKNNKTKYTLYAVKTEDGYALLNLVYINKLLLFEFDSPRNFYTDSSNIFPEKKINETLKVDFYIQGEKDIIIEAKGILSEEKNVKFPAMRVARAEKQLLQFENLLKQGVEIHYYIVLMNAAIKSIELDIEYEEFKNTFIKCIKKGMKLFVYKAIWQNEFIIKRDLRIEQEFLQQYYRSIQ